MLYSGRKGLLRKYLSFFRMRFIGGLQYRAAALAGVSTQFAWGILEILVFRVLYEMNPGAFPMSMKELSAYIWLRQAFLTLFMIWFQDDDIFKTITEGGIAYELCRPVNLYNMWYTRSIAGRLSKAVLRCLPIIIVAAFIPEPYGIGLPADLSSAIWFVITAFIGLIVVVAFNMLIYISAFFTFSPTGVRMVAISAVEFFAGDILPIPFMPEGVRQVVEILPFASMQNVPLRIYSGNISGIDLYLRVGLQLFWAIALIWLGKLLTNIALKRVIVQGG